MQRALHDSATAAIAFDCTKLVLIIEGHGTISTPRGEVTFRPGIAVLLPHGMPAEGRPEARVETVTLYIDSTYLKHQTVWVSADDDPISRLLRLAANGTGAPVSLSVNRGTGRGLGECGRHITRGTSRKASPGWWLLASASRMIASLTIAPAEASSPLRREVNAVLDALRADPARAWTTEAIAREVHLSSSQVARLFNAQVGVPPIRALQRIRAERFAQLLETTDWTAKRCAETVGWNDADYAAVLLHRYFGVTPRQYRNRLFL